MNAPARGRARRVRTVAGFVIGVALLGGAVYAAASRGGFAEAWAAARAAPIWLIGLALVLPPLNLAATSMSFWVQMRRHGSIGAAEMAALIGAAWLLNCLPLRPGMFGRIAYHKAVNGIAVRDSVRAMVVGLAAGLASVAVVLAIAAAMGPDRGARAWAAALSVPGAVAGVMALSMRRGWIAGVFFFRYLDVLIWVLRYWVTFRLVGVDLTPGQAAAVAAVSQLALNIPLVGNGLGVREWAVGLTAANLPSGLFGAGGKIATAAGLSADLVNRAAEMAVCVPLGVGCVVWAGRRIGRR